MNIINTLLVVCATASTTLLVADKVYNTKFVESNQITENKPVIVKTSNNQPCEQGSIDYHRNVLRTFLDAIAKVESNNNDAAIGDAGKAIGRYQIWQIYWQDAVEYSPSIGGQYSDCTNKDYAERVMVSYLLRYAKTAVENRDYEKLARIHNGGPRGHKKNATLAYWNKVNKILVK